MIEVIPHPHGPGFTWRMICAVGRVLVYSVERFPTILDAAEAAKRYRTAFWRIASQVDHRMAACI